MILLEGKKVANEWLSELKARVRGRDIRLMVVLVGDDPASLMYDNMKVRRATEIGIAGELVHLPEDTTEAELMPVLDMMNDDENVAGILVQLPLPKHIREEKVLARISPAKDVDGLTPYNKGLLFSGFEDMPAATPLGIIKLLETYDISVEGKHAVVVGDSNIVGRPLAAMLLNRGATVSIAHEKTAKLEELTRAADLLFVGAGKPGLITKKHVKPGAVVVDIGTTKVGDKTLGDADFDSVSEVAGAITPVPGGVGPMTIAALLSNTVLAWELSHGKTPV